MNLRQRASYNYQGPMVQPNQQNPLAPPGMPLVRAPQQGAPGFNLPPGFQPSAPGANIDPGFSISPDRIREIMQQHPNPMGAGGPGGALMPSAPMPGAMANPAMAGLNQKKGLGQSQNPRDLIRKAYGSMFSKMSNGGSY